MSLRFAPSPTGYLHVGNIRPALINYLYAKKHNASFILRIDDTDKARCKPEYTEALLQDLEWLGISYDQIFHQSERFLRYEHVKELLVEAGHLYPCYETPEELEVKRRLLLAQGLPPIYDRSGLKLSDAQRKAFEAEGRKPHWRFKLPDMPVTWNDLVKGPMHFRADVLSDPILIREDGCYLYTFTSVIDDIDYKIRFIFRGEDHVTNTATQISIFKTVAQCLGEPFDCEFGHMSLLVAPDGGKLSKRAQSVGIRDLRADGFEPMSILSYLVYAGTPRSIKAHHYLHELLYDFDVTGYSGGSPRFNVDEVRHLNENLFHTAHINWLRDRQYHTTLSEDVWNIVRYNVSTAADIKTWETIFSDDFKTSPDYKIDTHLIEQALASLPPETWTKDTWKTWTQTLKESTGLSGKALYQPLRQILTNCDHGPEMQLLLPLLGYQKVKQRLITLKAAKQN